MTVESLGWITVDATRDGKLEAVATLGPAGTSSEQAANLLWRQLSGPQFDDTGLDCAGLDEARIWLYDSYEEAADAVRSGTASHFVVANAYRNINEFYMDSRVALSAVFVMDTPLYGLAKLRDAATIPKAPSIASHPSPIPLIAPLLPREYVAGEITIAPSTSAAARAVQQRVVDLALTTEPAARAYGLTFISRTRPIRMVWSVFTAS